MSEEIAQNSAQLLSPIVISSLEIFIGKLPREITEIELREIFEQFGEIQNLRIMKFPTGTSRGFGFITYANEQDGRNAIHYLNGKEIRPRIHIEVSQSFSNRRLFVGNIPKSKTKEELFSEFEKLTPGLKDVIIYLSPDEFRHKNRGFCFLDYQTHGKAAQALKILLSIKPKRILDCDILVDWADQEEVADDEVMSKVKIVYVKNLSSSVTEEQLQNVFSICGEIERVRKIKSFAFIHYVNRRDAEEAIVTLNGRKLGGTNIEVVWARPPTNKSKREELLRNREYRTMHLLTGKSVKPCISGIENHHSERSFHSGQTSTYPISTRFPSYHQNYLHNNRIPLREYGSGDQHYRHFNSNSYHGPDYSEQSANWRSPNLY